MTVTAWVETPASAGRLAANPTLDRRVDRKPFPENHDLPAFHGPERLNGGDTGDELTALIGCRVNELMTGLTGASGGLITDSVAPIQRTRGQ